MAYPVKTPEAVIAHVDGWPVHIPNLPAAVSRIIEKAREGYGFTVFTLNLDHLVKLRTNRAFREAYRKADLVTADGAPVAWLARFQRQGIERTTGADLFVPLARAAARHGLPVYIFGSSVPVLAKAAQVLRKATGDKIVFAGLQSPSADFDPLGAEADAAIAEIKASSAKICYIALSPPKNEIFSARAVDAGCVCGFVCVGAAADFVAGAQIRAPQIFQNYGMEWLWRLLHNPRRLTQRYVNCARVLVDIALMAPIRRSLNGREI